ncbi:hypothetical protein [Shewanella nanhaiensis]|uniref:Uncharacterized protein n=1 Tax=Shewanella nanhaiensis TaxID=2864872 RepID=A0ABS7E1T3_9GAMM|nr:hypothetical protein [Shewanella nanhaiensis]MBW8183121.1 hypothetical protein [Shewanella nanhaiensis]
MQLRASKTGRFGRAHRDCACGVSQKYLHIRRSLASCHHDIGASMHGTRWEAIDHNEGSI